MKKTFLLGVLVVLSLSACGSETKTLESQNNDIHNNIVDNNDIQDNKAESQNNINENEANELEKLIDASTYIDTIYGVEEYKDGVYVVYGLNVDKINFCGLLYSDGKVKVFEDYTRIYPLKEGRFLATTEEDANNTSYSFCTNLQDIAVTGEIIDEDGNFIFSDDRFLRLIPLGYNRAMVFLANSGFDGVTLEFGLIDGDGNWISELGTKNEIGEMWVELVKCNNDGTWNFIKKTTRTEGGKIYEVSAFIQENNGIVQVKKSVTYDKGLTHLDISESFFYCIDTDKIYVDAREYKSAFSTSFSNKTMAFTTYFSDSEIGYDVYDLDSNLIEKISASRGTVNKDYYVDVKEGQIRNIVNGTVVKLQEKLLDSIRTVYEFNERIYAIFRGQDKNYYIVEINSDELNSDNFTLLNYYDGNDILFFDKVMVYNSDDGKICIVDLDSYNVLNIIDITPILGSAEEYELYKLDDDTFTVKCLHEKENECVIYCIDGEKIF